jgi:hypothetical protein
LCFCIFFGRKEWINMLCKNCSLCKCNFWGKSIATFAWS